MEYRKIKKEEFVDLRKIHSLVYFMEYDAETTDKYPGAEDNRWKSGYGAFDDDGSVHAVLEAIPFRSYLDGEEVRSPGIAGVATLLEQRRKGHVRKLLETAFKDMHENGDVMSYLYPFSHEYYRKFGYSQCARSMVIKTGIEKVIKSDHKGYTRQYFPGDSFDDLIHIYEGFSKKYNCSVAREVWRWKRLYSDDPYKTDVRVFIRYNPEGEPVAYLKIKTREIDQYTFDMIVTEAAWIKNEGIMALASIINGYSDNLRKMELEVPMDFPVSLFVREVWEQESIIRYKGMNRIVDAQKALEVIKKPGESGSVVIGLQDEYCSWNTGNWSVEWDDEGMSQVQRTDAGADMECSAGSFSQMVTGRYDVGALEQMGRVEISKNKSALMRLFIEKPCFLWDGF